MASILRSIVLAFGAASFANTHPIYAQAHYWWTDINPNRSSRDPIDPDAASGGRINRLGRASNGREYYAASEWGGLYKSSDGGQKWQQLAGHVPMLTWDVEVDPSDANRVYATAFYDGRVQSLSGINVSSDDGRTWTHPTTATPPTNFCATEDRRDNPSAFGIAIDPLNTNRVFIGTNCGLAISQDAGVTWSFVDPTPSDPADDIWAIVVHHGGIIDLCGDDGHQRSIDGGITWTTATGIALPSGRCSLAVSPEEAYVLIAVSGRTIRESDNSGGTWGTIITNPAPQGRIPFVATNDRAGTSVDLRFGDTRRDRATCATPNPPAVGGAARCPTNSWTGPFTRSHGDCIVKPNCAHDDAGDIVF